MPTLIGGSGSTGSSLLRTILNRHPVLFSGEELNFFNKEQLFQDWHKYRHRCMGYRHWFPFSTRGWFEWPGVQLTHADYGWSSDEIRHLLLTNPSIRAFAETFFQRALERESAQDWIEKTPSNAYSFRYFLGTFPEGKVIHTSRNALAAIASLIRRGMTPFYATGLWLYNTASALSVSSDPRYLLVRYEDLTNEPERTIRQVCGFLGVRFDPLMLEPQEADGEKHVRNPGWTYDRTTRVSPSVNKFRRLNEEVQQQVRDALSLLRISQVHAKAKGITDRSCTDIAQKLGYQFNLSHPKTSRSLKWLLWKDCLRRTCRRYSTGLGFYPLEVSARE